MITHIKHSMFIDNMTFIQAIIKVLKNLQIEKSFSPCQPAQSAQADMGQYF